MSKKVCALSLMVLMLAMFLSACGGLFKPKVALMLARGGLGDKAFNDSANAGLQRVAKELGAETKTFEFQGNDKDEVNLLREVAQQSYDPIIVIGAENLAALNIVSAEYPKLNFVMIDGVAAEGRNVTSVVFNELDGDFLAGALAGLMSKSGKVGFLGGADVPVIRRIQFGFEQGVKYVNPKAQIEVRLIADKDDYSGFARPDIGERLGLRMYEVGDEIIYVAAGGSGLGTINAAKLKNMPIITTGTDQQWLGPTVVLTSRTKNMDYVVFWVVQQFMKSALPNGLVTLDYKSGGIGLAPINEKLVPADILAKFQTIRANLEAGKIPLKPAPQP